MLNFSLDVIIAILTFLDRSTQMAWLSTTRKMHDMRTSNERVCHCLFKAWFGGNNESRNVDCVLTPETSVVHRFHVLMSFVKNLLAWNVVQETTDGHTTSMAGDVAAIGNILGNSIEFRHHDEKLLKRNENNIWSRRYSPNGIAIGRDTNDNFDYRMVRYDLLCIDSKQTVREDKTMTDQIQGCIGPFSSTPLAHRPRHSEFDRFIVDHTVMAFVVVCSDSKLIVCDTNGKHSFLSDDAVRTIMYPYAQSQFSFGWLFGFVFTDGQQELIAVDLSRSNTTRTAPPRHSLGLFDLRPLSQYPAIKCSRTHVVVFIPQEFKCFLFERPSLRKIDEIVHNGQVSLAHVCDSILVIANPFLVVAPHHVRFHRIEPPSGPLSTNLTDIQHYCCVSALGLVLRVKHQAPASANARRPAEPGHCVFQQTVKRLKLQ
jgi:hypothetical protein